MLFGCTPVSEKDRVSQIFFLTYFVILKLKRSSEVKHEHF